ncbi:MAG: M1 family aminopeptidase [Parvularcula sp.]|jgi:hypothetical protein|nr:M1 family aminopeptidase [Parvularcula sp.]
MFRSVLKFELSYQLRGAAFLAIFAIFFLLVFGAVTVDQIQIGTSDAININSPAAAATNMGVMAVIGIFIPVVFLASGILRDSSLKTEETFGSLPVKPRTMLVGRFVGGLIASWLAFLAVPLAFHIGTLMPWLDQEQIGPSMPGAVLYYYLIFGVANITILGSILFTVANLTRSMIATWVALVLIFIGWTVAITVLDEFETRQLAALIEPYGLAAFAEVTRYWTAAEQNSEVVPLSGLFLTNRLLWAGIGAAFFAVNLLLPRGLRGFAFGRKKKIERSPQSPALRPVTLPMAQPAPLHAASWQQLARRTRYETFGILRSVAFWVVLMLSVFNTIGSLLFLDNLYGATSYPVTRLMVQGILGAFAFVPLIIAVYYTAELVWRERSYRFNEIVDATPTPSWVLVGAKFVAVFVALVLMALTATVTAIITQIARGYTALELNQYAVRLTVDFVLAFGYLTVLALFLQVLTNNKWLGIGAILAYTVVGIVLDQMGFDHMLYTFGSGFNMPYSDMNRYGPFLGIAGWMGLYWGLFCVLLGLITFALWSRGSLEPIGQRLITLPRRFSSSMAATFAVALVLFGATGSWVFYNTNVRNEYRTDEQDRQRAEDYERTYREAYEFAPQPVITSVDLDIDLFPKERRAAATTTYVLANQSDAPIERMNVDYSYASRVLSQDIEGAQLSETNEEFNHFIFAFEPALRPGEERVMTSTIEIANPGFRNSSNNSPIRRNGTFINSSYFAQIGLSPDKMLSDRSERRKRDLPENPRVPKLEDERYWSAGLFSGAHWIDFRAEITTDADQIAVAPGYLVSDETKNGRRTFVYEQDVPIQNFYAVQSARYEVAEDVWDAPEGMNDVTLQVFYDPKHPFNVERMLEAMQLSFNKFTEVFTPYQYRQLRIQEFPYASFAQSFPNTVPYSENIGFITRLDERAPDAIDPVTYVTAHEIAHQWFGHQLSAAGVQGSTMLIESFSQYAALLVMEDLYGREHMRRFLRYELDDYLSGRANEPIEELPLYRVENQQYIHYQKGSLVMYLLRDQLGEEVVNRAITRMLEEWAYQSDPYPRSTDFLAILREEAGPEADDLITDLFERIVLFDVEVTNAEARQRSDGKWDLTLTLDAAKLVSDGAGNETEEPFALEMDLGIFSEHPRQVKDGTDHIIVMQRRMVESGEMTLELVVEKEPAFAGVDPYNKLIDRQPENNIVPVTVVSAEETKVSSLR